jgi:predicted permease
LPVWARWLIAVAPRRDRGDDVPSDLAELFDNRCVRYGRLYAHRRLGSDVLSLWRGAFRGGTMRQDLRYALRLFRKQPGPVAIAVLGLAVAIGVVTTMFSLVNATMLRPFGMDDPESVVSVMDGRHGREPFPWWPYRHFRTMRAASSLSTLEASMLEKARFSGRPAEDGGPVRWLRFVSGGYLQTIGGRPFLGRPLVPADDEPGAPLAVVVSHPLWSTDLNADPAVVGKTVWANGVAATLVGVLEPGFTGPGSTRPSVWMPFAAADEVQGGAAYTPTSNILVEVIARLAPGASREAAEASLAAIVAEAQAQSPAASERARVPQLYSAATPIDGPDAGESYLALASLFAVVGLVLVLACANTANLLMASASTRAREIGVRLALGATSRRLVRQLVTESVLLAVAAGALGYVLAQALAPIVGGLIEISPEINLAPDRRVLLFAVAVALVCGLGAGLSPARYGARGNVLVALRSGGSVREGHRSSWLRGSFVGLQAAVSMLLLVGAMLLTRTAVSITRTDAGFDVDRLLGVHLGGDRRVAEDPAFLVGALEALRGIPVVQGVSVSQRAPFGMSVESNTASQGGRSYDLYVQRVDDRYFEVIGLQLLRGRTFGPDEVMQEAPVALVSERVVQTVYGGRDPVGLPLSTMLADGFPGDLDATIIGVVGEAMLSRGQPQSFGTVYRPLQRERSNPPSLIIRTAAPALAAHHVEQALRRVNARVSPTTTVVGESLEAFLASKRMLAWMAGPLALLAFILATLGVFGVTAFVVSQRSHEVSVRLAIGATAGDVLRLLVSDSLRPVAIGLVVGLVAALGISRVFASLLAGISPHDPVSVGLATALLLTGALVAVVVPARRVARVDPAGILRAS